MKEVEAFVGQFVGKGGADLEIWQVLLRAFAAFRRKGFGNVVKGHASQLVKDGQIDWDAMRRHDITLEDLKESMRLTLKSEDVGQVQSATLERNGNVSFQTKAKEPRIVEIEVKEGVQRVRLEIS